MTVDTNSIPKEQDLIQHGNEAEALLGNQMFSKTVNGLIEATFAGFVNTKPDETTQREQAYHHYKALQDIVNTLHQRVAIRDEILASDESDNNGEE